MKYISPLIFLLYITSSVQAQSSTEIYLFDLNDTKEGILISNPVNISDNEGYDNQPSFTEDGKSLIFASTRNGQTDILWYDIDTGSKKWISKTEGGEYSPVLMPDGKHASAVRLDPDGLQLLYKYSIADGSSKVLIPDLKIGYYSWISSLQIIAFVLGEPQTLQQIDVSTGEVKSLQNNPGRSIHRIPGTKNYSFIDKSDPDDWKIMEGYLSDSESPKKITSTLSGSEDMVWLDMNTIVMGKDDKLYYFDRQQKPQEWQMFADLSDYDLDGITRLAFKNGQLAIVVSGK